jgi:hypothetical protein
MLDADLLAAYQTDGHSSEGLAISAGGIRIYRDSRAIYQAASAIRGVAEVT